MPTVDIVCRTAQRPVLLRRALASIQGQEFRDWRVILVNDGGDPGPVTSAVAAAIPDPTRVSLVHHPAPLGRPQAFNAGLALATAPFLAWHDDDDSWHPAFLTQTVAELASPSHQQQAAIACHLEVVTESIHGEEIRQHATHPWPFPQPGMLSLADFLIRNRIAPIAMLFRTENLRRLGGCDPSLAVLEDWELLLRLLMDSDIPVLPACLARYHHRPEATGADANSIIGGLSEHLLHRTLITNRLLREDLRHHRVGLGSWLALDSLLHQHLAQQKSDLIRHTCPLRSLTRRLKRFLGFGG
jgi:GT2 family glycosyltransferase